MLAHVIAGADLWRVDVEDEGAVLDGARGYLDRAVGGLQVYGRHAAREAGGLVAYAYRIEARRRGREGGVCGQRQDGRGNDMLHEVTPL